MVDSRRGENQKSLDLAFWRFLLFLDISMGELNKALESIDHMISLSIGILVGLDVYLLTSWF